MNRYRVTLTVEEISHAQLEVVAASPKEAKLLALEYVQPRDWKPCFECSAINEPEVDHIALLERGIP